MASTIYLGTFLLVVSTVTVTAGMPQMGPACRIVNTTNEAILESTPCPFSDLDDPLYICVNGSRSNSRSAPPGGFGAYPPGIGYGDYDRQFNYDDDYYRNFPWPRLPRTRKDYCRLNLKKTDGRCRMDSECKSYPGLVETLCYYGRCIPEFTSVALTMMRIDPCEIALEGGDPTYNFRAIDACKNGGRSIVESMYHYFNPYEGGSQRPTYECPQNAQMSASADGRKYNLKLCVKATN